MNMIKANSALKKAISYLECEPELEIRSALKEAGNDAGIAWGDEMEKFVLWAEQKLGL